MEILRYAAMLLALDGDLDIAALYRRRGDRIRAPHALALDLRAESEELTRQKGERDAAALRVHHAEGLGIVGFLKDRSNP